MHSNNVTHHLPVLASILFSRKVVPSEVTEILARPKVAWKKCTADQFSSYQNCLNENLHSLPVETEDNPEKIESYTRSIFESFKVADIMLPSSCEI